MEYLKDLSWMNVFFFLTHKKKTTIYINIASYSTFHHVISAVLTKLTCGGITKILFSLRRKLHYYYLIYYYYLILINNIHTEKQCDLLKCLGLNKLIPALKTKPLILFSSV